MAAFLDICRFNPTAGGTTDWTYAAAVTGYLSPAAAGAVNGRIYKYRAESVDLSQWEIGEGAHNSGVFARTTVLFNSDGTTAKVNFSAAPQVAVVALKEDLISIEEANAFTAAQQAQARANIAADFPTGTVMLFYQAAAPTGWTKLTTQNDKALRVVSGTGGVAGGTYPWSSIMVDRNTNGYALTAADVPNLGVSVSGAVSGSVSGRVTVYPNLNAGYYYPMAAGTWAGYDNWGTSAFGIYRPGSPGQQGAIDQIVKNSNGQPNYSAPIQSGTLGLLNGGGANNNNSAIEGNLADYFKRLSGTADGSNMGANSALKGQLDQITTDVTNQVNGSWAAAGRDGSPGNMPALGRGIASGVAPVIAAQYNTDADRAMNAATALYNGGNSTYGMLNANQAQANQNFTNGIGAVSGGLNAENAAPNAALDAMAKQFGIPASQLIGLLGAIAPVAGAFGTQTGQSQGESQMSGAQQFATIASGLGSLWPKGNISFGG